MDDLISRQKAKDAIDMALDRIDHVPPWVYDKLLNALNELPSVHPPWNPDEWCHDCKEYDKEKHCCPRWNRVIRNAMEEAKPRKGKWITDNPHSEIYRYACSECHAHHRARYDFCPSCGCRMEEGDAE